MEKDSIVDNGFVKVDIGDGITTDELLNAFGAGEVFNRVRKIVMTQIIRLVILGGMMLDFIYRFNGKIRMFEILNCVTLIFLVLTEIKIAESIRKEFVCNNFIETFTSLTFCMISIIVTLTICLYACKYCSETFLSYKNYIITYLITEFFIMGVEILENKRHNILMNEYIKIFEDTFGFKDGKVNSVELSASINDSKDGLRVIQNVNESKQVEGGLSLSLMDDTFVEVRDNLAAVLIDSYESKRVCILINKVDSHGEN